MIRNCLTILLTVLCVVTSAQKRGQLLIDSLLPELAKAKEDTGKTILYYQISQAYVMIDPGLGMRYADTGLKHAAKLGWDKGRAFMYISQGNILNDAGKGDAAIDVYKKAYSISEKAHDQKTMATAINDIGGVYHRKSDFTNAMSWYMRSMKIAEEINDANMLGIGYTNLATVYYNQKDYTRAISYSTKALAIYEKLDDPDKEARALNYIGNAYFDKGDVKKVEPYYRKALRLYEQTNNRTGMAILYSQIAILYDPDYKKIIEYQEKSQAIWDSINPSHYNSIINLGNTGESYLNIIRADSMHLLSPAQRTEALNKAGAYLNRAIRYSQETNDRDNISYFSAILSGQQELKGDYKSALENYKFSVTVHDSLYSQENKNKIASLESQREIDLRDKEIVINKLALANERRQRFVMIGGLALLIIIGALLFFQSRNRKRTNTTLLQLNNELDEANKIKARFFAILSHDLRSPISSLVSFLEIQQEGPGLINASDAATHQKNISAAAKALLENMEAMLLWSKGEMENFKPNIRKVAVRDMFDYIQKFFAATTGVKISFADPGNLMVSTDENYLQTIMHNLTANAVKVLSDTPDATIEWKATADGDRTILSITDNGPGIREDQIRALYDDSAVPNSKTGFGLHVIRDLAKAIHCKIAMQSFPGVGTTFTLLA